ncbi:P-loop NTPase fold protein [Fodinicola acaciae]|uniref:P-loop NTPase fold protein n=1 Tax=Fodinicola acaciae TaxID=2681555 RepID=UPI0013D3C259|nr:P-loop NTPase fold protein [Fodinicola acaciae]
MSNPHQMMPLPEPHAGHVAQVLATIARSRKELAAWHNRRDFSTTMLDRRSESVIAITGRRGAGKTTVLHSICSQLQTRKDIVLSVIRPEFFSANDSVLGMALASLERTLGQKYEGLLTHAIDDDTTISTALYRLFRRASIVGARELGYDRPLAQSLDNIADDFVRSASAGAAFIDQWSELAGRVFREIGDGQGILIVPIDDADLTPELLPRILVDLRILTSAPGVICLVCIDIDEARFALGEHYLRAYPHLGSDAAYQMELQQRLNGIIESQLAKAIPPQRRITIRELSLRERLAYFPLNTPSSEPLLDLLARFSLPAGGAPATTLAELFTLGDKDQPSPYARCLSSNPRDLESLHFQLQKARAERADLGARLAVRAILEHGLQFGLRNSPVSIRASDLMTFDPSFGTNTLRIDFEKIGLALHRPSETLTLPTRSLPSGSEIALGLLSETVGTLSERRGGERMSARIDVAATNSLLLAREFSYSQRLVDEESIGGLPSKGGMNGSNAVRVSLGMERVDNLLLLHPAWEGHYDYFLVSKAWAEVHQAVRIARTSATDHKSIIAAATLEWWRIHAHIQRERTLPSSLGDIVRSCANAGALEANFESVWRSIEHLYRNELERNEERARDFVFWVEVYLLFICHPAICPRWFTEKLLKSRQRMVDQFGRGPIANSRLAARMSERLRKSTQASWIVPFIELTKFFDESVAYDIERLHRAAQAERQRALAVRIGESSVSTATDMSPDQDALHSAAIVALRELEADAKAEPKP